MYRRFDVSTQVPLQGDTSFVVSVATLEILIGDFMFFKTFLSKIDTKI
jgi:hypothetical protein